MTSYLELESDLWVYGSGSFAYNMIVELERLDFSIRGVIDHLNLGKEIQTDKFKYNVQSLDEVVLAPKSQVVLAVCNLNGDLKKISSKLFPGIKVISPVNLFRYFADHGLSLQNYWLSTEFELYAKSIPEIDTFRDVLEDEDSKELLDRILKYRQNGRIDDLPEPRPLSEQYLASDLCTPPTNLRIIDLGACQGENLSDFLEAGHFFIDGYLFEPDQTNLQQLSHRLSALNIETLDCQPFGAWNETTTLRFQSSGNASASISASGVEYVNVVALDEFIPSDYAPNFIKMDIEGAEMKALEGMVKLVKSHRPHLAVSVYHKPSDLWEIGNFLNKSFPGLYRYFLRVYGEQTFDTILYAVPKEFV